jgi:hypothetical protein
MLRSGKLLAQLMPHSRAVDPQGVTNKEKNNGKQSAAAIINQNREQQRQQSPASPDSSRVVLRTTRPTSPTP